MGFNIDHYMKVRKERQKRGLPMFEDLYPDNGRIFDHELEGKKIIRVSDNKEYTIQSVHKHWYEGWYIMILAYSLSETTSELLTKEIIDGKRYGHSHTTLFWENISCHYDIILEGIEENKLKYKLVF